jgi:hypothetical protein
MNHARVSRSPHPPIVRLAGRWLRSRVRLLRRLASDAGMTTAEYAIGTVAACGFAALLYRVVTSGAVSSALSALVRRALSAV